METHTFMIEGLTQDLVLPPIELKMDSYSIETRDPYVLRDIEFRRTAQVSPKSWGHRPL